MIKKNKGITLIALSITVIIILIITGVLLYASQDSMYIKKLTNMQNDIEILRDKISLYYSEHGDIPVKTEYQDIGNLETAGVIGVNDTGKFYIIELESLEGLTLNYGEDYEVYKANGYQYFSDLTDIYIINADSHNIFYVEGIKVIENGTTQMYYTDYTQGDQEAVNIVEVVPIPEGFYHVEGTTVEKGYVISDEEGDDLNNSKKGNQYVWIPVDGILGEDGDINDIVNNGKILLGRYEFNEDGIPSEYLGTDYIEETQTQHAESKYDNTIASDIEEFIDSVRKNGGYYIARFEASQDANNKAQSQYNQTAWINITQPDAAKACQELHAGVKSDLMNSYAWDTAILFIQKYGQTDYSRQDARSIHSSRLPTGLSGDMQLNIFDMAANTFEWTTETSTNSSGPCVHRGGFFYTSSAYTSYRVSLEANYSDTNRSFRSILYLKNEG